jgi:hypothetical protein
MKKTFSSELSRRIKEIKHNKDNPKMIFGRSFAKDEIPEFKNSEIRARDISPYLAGNDILNHTHKSCAYRYKDVKSGQFPEITIV